MHAHLPNVNSAFSAILPCFARVDNVFTRSWPTGVQDDITLCDAVRTAHGSLCAHHAVMCLVKRAPHKRSHRFMVSRCSAAGSAARRTYRARVRQANAASFAFTNATITSLVGACVPTSRATTGTIPLMAAISERLPAR